MPTYTTIPADGDAPGKALLAIEWSFFLLAVGSIVLRLRTRRRKSQTLRFDDWSCIVAMVFTTFIAINHTISVAISGLGLPQTDVSMDSVVLTAQLIPAAEACWSVANTAVKLSFLYFIMQVFNLQKYRLRVYLAAGAVVALGVGNLIQSLAICRPFAYQWDKTIEGGVCGEQLLGILLVAIFSLLVDLVIFLLPAPILWSLKLTRKKRHELIFIFCIGVFVTFVTIIRIIITVFLIRDPVNVTYWVSIAAILLFAEPGLSIVAACLPIWRPILFRQSQNSANGGRNIFSKTGAYEGGGGSDVARSIGGSRRVSRHHKSFIRLHELQSPTFSPPSLAEEGLVDDVSSDTVHDGSEAGRHDGPVISAGEKPRRLEVLDPHAITVTKSWDVQTADDESV